MKYRNIEILMTVITDCLVSFREPGVYFAMTTEVDSAACARRRWDDRELKNGRGGSCSRRSDFSPQLLFHVW